MLVVQVLQEFAVEVFFSYKSRKRRIFFLQTSYIKDTYVEAVEFRQGWSVSATRGHEKEEKKKTKEGGLSPQEGDVRRKNQKARRWLREGKVPCVLNQEISFFGSRVLGF